MNYCDFGHRTMHEIRALPQTTRPSANDLVCHYHYELQMRYRQMNIDSGLWTKEGTDFPKWFELEVNQVGEPITLSKGDFVAHDLFAVVNVHFRYESELMVYAKGSGIDVVVVTECNKLNYYVYARFDSTNFKKNLVDALKYCAEIVARRDDNSKG